ncbi:CdaR family protein [Companilactobacillus sp. DQM5]|uniref:CdaR family protein n=1 Tax=Companilactobacillus sp. DQM5 TaxID=3463359 RepID=UPI004057E940
MKNFFDSKYAYALVSLVIAIWLFISVSSPGSLSTRDAASKQIKQTATKVVTVKDVQVQTNVDDDKYFVTGYPSTVDVKLTGSSSLVETTKKTKNFHVILDLTNLGVGQHKVKLRTTGLNNEIKTNIKPEYVTVNIQTKISRVFPIQIVFDKSSIKSGYKVAMPTANPDTVTVSGPRSEVRKVAQVVADVDLPKNIKSNIDKEVLLQALDSDGKIVNVVLNPQTTHVSIPVTIPSKQVSLTTKQTGSPVDGYEYAMKLDTQSVKVYGDEDTLGGISELSIPIDVSKIKSDTKKTITLTDVFKDQIWDSDPKTVTVEITVKKTEDKKNDSPDTDTNKNNNNDEKNN